MHAAGTHGPNQLTHLDILEAESIFIIREVAAQFEHPVILYSVGKDSSVLLRLAEKAFYPGKVPFPLIHVDTGYKFPEMYEFRDRYTKELGLKLIVHRNEEAIKQGANPYDLGTQRCCGLLKTQALLQALAANQVDAAIGGARRDEERSRAKERVFSFRNKFGEWDPKNQRPELWSIYNGRIHQGESIRVFPLSNWTELDVWHYIKRENIPIVPLYYAQERRVIERGEYLIPVDVAGAMAKGQATTVLCRFRSLGCHHCTGAIRSSAKTIDDIIEEMTVVRTSERANRVIDHDSDGSMETKKREGYF
ncbi:MAG: sulfate adenylyltransferase subunit CysD [Bdellovibrionota bacterium]|nr:MAG: sulfate adenylyltransferase subunit CysD [Bdellovibrionota bacterium]